MDDDVETESLLDDEILSLLGGCLSWVDVAVGREEGATSADAFRRGLRFSGRSCRSARGTALRARGAVSPEDDPGLFGGDGSACAGRRRRGEARKAGTTSAACSEYPA